MITKQFRFEDVFATIYQYNKGDVLVWHKHSTEHSHGVFSGKTLIEIEGKDNTEVFISENINLPANIPHQITALEDNTIFVNIIKLVEGEDLSGKTGGILLDDGTIVYGT